MSNAKQRLTKEEWKALIEEWKESKETQPVFCERKGLRYSTFGYWRTQLKSQVERTEKRPIFKEVSVLRPERVEEVKQGKHLEQSIKLQMGAKLTLIFDVSLLGSILPAIKPLMGE